jgi:uncharacterized protein (AIM24 family)
VLERGTFLGATGPVRVVAIAALGTSARGWLALVFAPFRWIGAMMRKTAGGERFWSQAIEAEGDARVLASNPRGGQVVRIPLDDGTVTMQRGAWIGQTGDIELGVTVVTAFVRAVFAQAAWVWQSASGIGDVFLGAHGNIVTLNVPRGSSVLVESHNVLAWQGITAWSQRGLGSVRGTLFAGDGLALLEATGPGVVYLDTGSSLSARVEHLTRSLGQTRGDHTP